MKFFNNYNFFCGLITQLHHYAQVIYMEPRTVCLYLSNANHKISFLTHREIGDFELVLENLDNAFLLTKTTDEHLSVSLHQGR